MPRSHGGDRLSKLGDGVLGHILSFLPAKEAARTAVLSSRWRDAFAGVHTVSLEEPEGPIPDYDHRGCSSPGCRWGHPHDPNPPLPFTSAVTAALLARHRRPAAAPPLRALRVAMGEYSGGDSSTVDQWVSYAVKQAAPELELELRLRPVPVCCRPYSLRGREERALGVVPDGESNALSPSPLPARSDVEVNRSPAPRPRSRSPPGVDDDDIVSTDDEKTIPLGLLRPWELPPPEYTVPGGLFSCAALRSLRIGPCRLSPPATVSLPSIEELLLTRVSDEGKDVQRLISACPRLADLTLEACDTVTALSLLNMRLRRLALRCCHKLASVAVDASELQAFEYRGAVPEISFLTMRGGSRRITSCKVDICGQVASSVQELSKFREFLQLFADTKHLHLQSARLGSGVENGAFPAFPSLRHLELRGRLPHDDAAIVGAMTTILEHAPNLEVLSFFFEPDLHDDESRACRHYDKEEKLLDAHHLMYNRYDVPAAPRVLIPCLRSRVREINLVHYQGGRAQRTLAKFLLRNAPAVDELWCGFAEGPLWIQTELMREIKGWLMNDKANANFS